MSDLLTSIKTAVKEAMKAKEKQRLAALRLISAECKKVEVDERIELDDERVIAIITKMVKQRKDSITQYEDAGRDDLAETEKFELSVIDEFLPEALSDDELSQLVADAVSTSGAAGMQDMGKVMGVLKPQIQGRADMGQVSQMVKAQLAG